MDNPSYLTHLFTLAAFKILMCSDYNLYWLGSTCVCSAWSFLSFMDLQIHVFYWIGDIFSHYLGLGLGYNLSLSCPSKTPIMHILAHLLNPSGFFHFILFPFCTTDSISSVPSSSLLILSSACWDMVLKPSREFFNSVIFKTPNHCYM